jgi:hypothetical protein
MTGDAGAVTGATIGIGQTVVCYQFFLPRLSEVRRADPGEPGMRGDVLLGQAAAGAVSLAVAGLLAWLTGSAVPVYATLFVALVIAGFYQLAMNGNGVQS